MLEQMTISEEAVDRWKILAVTFRTANRSLALPVIGVIGNSVPTFDRGKQRLAEWKKSVASYVKQHRGTNPWNSRWHYAISIGFAFNLDVHRRQPLDPENFVKPSVDALAAGLFCSNDLDPLTIRRYNYDDSNFKYLFVQQLQDVPLESEEGAAFYVSALQLQ